MTSIVLQSLLLWLWSWKLIKSKVPAGISKNEELEAEELIEFMKLISEPSRFKIIQLLYYNSEISVNVLSILLDISQPAVSQHLKVLKLSSVIQVRRNGRKYYYSLDQSAIKNKYGNGINYLRKFFISES